MEFAKKTVFYLEDEFGTYAEIEIVEKDHKFHIVHTFVDEKYRGQGLAGKLMEQAVSYIQKQQGEIVAECSYAKSYLEKHPFSKN